MVWTTYTLADCDLDFVGCTPTAVDLYAPGEIPEVIADPPVVTLISPPAGTTLRPTDTAVFTVTASAAFVLLGFRVRFATGEREAAYDLTDPSGAWDARYLASSVEPIDGGYRLTLRRTGGWPAGGLWILPRVADALGQVPT